MGLILRYLRINEKSYCNLCLFEIIIEIDLIVDVHRGLVPALNIYGEISIYAKDKDPTN